jgi:SAM-dependent methyltransferase
VLRHLRREFPTARISACDLLESGVRFCAAQFGALPVPSAEDPAHIPLAGPFDLIWCGSLLTHLRASRWAGFLALFTRALATNGILLFTTCGRWVAHRLAHGEPYDLDGQRSADLLADYRRTGFGYADYPDTEGYGLSVASPAWVVAGLQENQQLRLLTYTERGWDDHQDVIALARI